MWVNAVDAESIWTIVVAAGSASRFGAPKQFLDLGGISVLDRSVATAARHSHGVVVVIPAEPVDGFDHGFDSTDPLGGVELSVVAGAESRAGSVRRGLVALPDDVSVVLVHDAARPLASDRIFERVIAAVLAGADAVAPVIPVTDTVRRRTGGIVDRDQLAAVQTPQGFRAHTLRAAHAGGADATDDVTLVEDQGGTVVLVDGDRRNLKLTSPLDLEVAALFLTSETTS